MAQQLNIQFSIKKTAWYYVLVFFSLINIKPGFLGIKTILTMVTGSGREATRVKVDFKTMEVVNG